MAKAYSPNLIYRNSNWIWHAGTPVHLLREPNGTVWVMQEYTKDVDPSLTLDNLHQVGGKLKDLPKGWVFETKVLTQGAVAQHGALRRLGGHHPRRAALHLPGLRLRRRHQRQLRAVDAAAGPPPGHRRLDGAMRLRAGRAQETQMNPITKDIPKAKTTLGLYVTAAEAYAMWQADPDHVCIIDVRTPEEHFFVGHPPMAWKIPLITLSYQWDAEKKQFPCRPHPDFVARVQSVVRPGDTILAMCRSGGRSAMAVNPLAQAGFTKVYNIIDGMEGDAVDDPHSVFVGQRLQNGWKNSGCPWSYKPTPERMVYPNDE